MLSCSLDAEVALKHRFRIALVEDAGESQLDSLTFVVPEQWNLGFFQGTAWIELQIENDDSDSTWMFVNNDVLNHSYEFYKLVKSANSGHVLQRLAAPLQTAYTDGRTYRHRHANVRLPLQQNEKATFLIKAVSDGRATDLSPRLVSLGTYFGEVNADNVWSIVFIVLTVFLLFVNLYLWFITGDSRYPYYFAYMIASVVMYMGLDGHIYTLGVRADWTDHLVFIALRLWVLFLFLFTIKFLESETTNPRLVKVVMRIVYGLLALNTLYQMLFFRSSIANLHFYENILSVLWLLMLVVLVIFSARVKREAFKAYLISISLLVGFILFGLLDGYFDLLPGSPFIYTKLGTLAEFFGFTYFMAFKIKNRLHSGQSLQEELQLNRKELSEQSTRLADLQAQLATSNKIDKTDLVSAFALLETSISTDADWAIFKEKFNALEPNFLTNLLARHPELTKSELRLITLAKIGYSQKEIANFLGIEPDSVKKGRTRLRKKLGLTEAMTLNEYLLEVGK